MLLRSTCFRWPNSDSDTATDDDDSDYLPAGRTGAAAARVSGSKDTLLAQSVTAERLRHDLDAINAQVRYHWLAA